MIKKFNTLFYNFIWQSKPDKIKRHILNQDYLKGGLKMIHLTNYIYSLKLSWIRRLVINDSNYKLLFENAYTSVKSLVTREVKYIEHIKNMCQNKFWTDVLQIWSIYIYTPALKKWGGILVYICPSFLPSVLPSVRPSVIP